MSRQVIKHPQAQRDLVALGRYIKQDNPAAARRFLKAANQAMRRLARMPELASKCEFDHPGLSEMRVWPIPKFENYLIFYCPVAAGIEVIRVVHGALDLEALFGR